MHVKNILGNFNIIGNNPDEEETPYKGTLSLTLNHKNEIEAKWLIHEKQEQFGVGTLNNNILVIRFYYIDELNVVCNGTAIYTCLTNNIFEGYWYEEQNDSDVFGLENCFRITDEKVN